MEREKEPLRRGEEKREEHTEKENGEKEEGRRRGGEGRRGKKKEGKLAESTRVSREWRSPVHFDLFMPHWSKASSGNNIKKGWPDTRGVARTLDPKTDSFPKKPTERDRTDVFPPLVSTLFPSTPILHPPSFSLSFIYSRRIGSGNASGLMSTDNAASSWRCNLLWNFSSTSPWTSFAPPPFFLTNYVYTEGKEKVGTRRKKFGREN